MPCCGSSDPGTLPRASRNSRTSAMRIEVSCRQPHRAQAMTPNVPGWGRTGGVSVSPAISAAAVPSAGAAPLPAAGVRTSVIGSGPSGHFGEDVPEARVARLADDPPGDVAVPVDHERARDGRRRHGAAEGEGDLATLIAHVRVADAEILHEGLGARGRVPDIDPYELNALGLVPLGENGQGGSLRAARRAPGAPEVHDDHLAAVGTQAEPGAGQRGAGDGRSRRPAPRLEVGAVPVA